MTGGLSWRAEIGDEGSTIQKAGPVRSCLSTHAPPTHPTWRLRSTFSATGTFWAARSVLQPETWTRVDKTNSVQAYPTGKYQYFTAFRMIDVPQYAS